ncbi:MAG: hypothetical protein R3212_12305 [Xanthomonadales bacterium]|nr:hypothetical protein [Xanthomonadales bacterium]
MNHEAGHPYTPLRLALRLLAYYAALIAFTALALAAWPGLEHYLPIGGHDALEAGTAQSVQELISGHGKAFETEEGSPPRQVVELRFVLPFVVAHLLGTILAMLPVAWTYKAINWDSGFRKTFVRSLILLPLCATTTVLLIQDSLALAFGLAALVAAVRFRVSLDEASDGIFIFAAICVGLAAGIGFLGISVLMSVFFCFTSLVMWARDFGRNPVDEARLTRKHA